MPHGAGTRKADRTMLAPTTIGDDIGVGLSANQEKRKKQLANLHPVKKGDPSLNPSGRPKSKPFLDAIQKHIKEHPEDVTAAIKAAFAQTKRGSFVHLRELADRTDGPVKQQVEHTGEDGGPIEHTIKFGVANKSDEPESDDEH